MTDDEILAKILAGDGAPEETERLLKQAAADPALARRVADLAAIEAMLGVAAEDDLAREHRVRRTMDFLRERERDDFVVEVRSRITARRRWWRGISAAAATLALLGTGWIYLGMRSVATIARTETVSWQGDARKSGEGLRAGSRVVFESGLMEIRAGERGTMIVDGPADLELVSTGHAILHRGRVVMRTRPDGGGYRLETPMGAVEEGREFALYVPDRNHMEAHALSGPLEFVSTSGKRVEVKENQALQLDPRGDINAAADRLSFYTSLPPERGERTSFVHWPMDEGSGLRAAAIDRNMPGGPKDLALQAMDQGNFPVWTEGRHGRGLAFDGQGAFAESGFPGIPGGEPRTVCFWVKVPRDFSPREGFGVVSWGHFSSLKPGGVWQIAINPLEEEGPLGRIRVGVHAGQVVGSTDLRDGLWHHVAVVLYGDSSPDVGTHVMVYLDGKLESISRRALQEVRTDVDTADHGVWIGRNITYTESIPYHHHGGFFRGEVDEVYIFSGALSDGEILHLMERNQPPE